MGGGAIKHCEGNMKKLSLFVLAVSLSVFVFLWFQEPNLVKTVEGTVLALKEDEGPKKGKRVIQVRMPDENVVWIETYVPFFYKVGYDIKLEIYTHILFGTTYVVVPS